MSSKPKSTRDRKPFKWMTTLEPLANGKAITRFDAARIGDSTLNSTVPDLERKKLKVSREWTTVPGRFGLVRCMRYSLTPTEQKRAQQLLAQQ